MSTVPHLAVPKIADESHFRYAVGQVDSALRAGHPAEARRDPGRPFRRHCAAGFRTETGAGLDSSWAWVRSSSLAEVPGLRQNNDRDETEETRGPSPVDRRAARRSVGVGCRRTSDTRAELKDRLKRGGTNLQQVLKDAETDEVLGKMKVSACTGGPAQGRQGQAQGNVATELEIAPTRRLRGRV